MAFCANCGTEVNDGTKFCPSCGAAIGAAQANAPENGAAQADASAPKNAFEKLNDTPDYTGQFSADDIEKNKIMAVLSYLHVLVLVPMFAAKESPYAQYHAKQGVTLFVCYIAYHVLSFVLRLIKTTQYIWGVPYQATPPIIGTIIWLLSIPLAVLSIIGILNALNGRAKELPIIGKFKIMK